MSRILDMANCIQEVKDTMKEIEERNEICQVLARSMCSMCNIEDRFNYFECFRLNEDIRNHKLKDLHERMLGVLHTLQHHFVNVNLQP